MAFAYFAGGTALYIIGIILIVWTGLYRKHLSKWEIELETQQRTVSFAESVSRLRNNADNIVDI